MSVHIEQKEQEGNCQHQAKDKAKAMPGRLYIHTINKNHFCVLFEFSQKVLSQGHEHLCTDSSRPN